MDYILSLTIVLLFVSPKFVSGHLSYTCDFTDRVMSCDDFENKNVKANDIALGMMEGSDEDDPALGLSGPLVLEMPLEDGHSISLNIFKSTEVGEEYMFKSTIKVCDSMKDEDTPWFPIFEMMNISSCPIKAGSYAIKDFSLSAARFSDYMSHNFVGEYSVQMVITEELDKVVSCHVVQMAITEHDD